MPAEDGGPTSQRSARSMRSTKPQDLAAVSAALDAIYRPWLDQAAKALQEAVGSGGQLGQLRRQALRRNPPTARSWCSSMGYGSTSPTSWPSDWRSRGVSLNVGGLVGAADGHPDRQAGAGPDRPGAARPGRRLSMPAEPPAARPPGCRCCVRCSPKRVCRCSDLRRPVIPSGRAWTETGEIDHKGHDLGIRLAHEINDEVSRIARRIRDLLDAGWSTVTVVTDHGWMLLPSGLPKNEACRSRRRSRRRAGARA